jgi:hypothetical protein
MHAQARNQKFLARNSAPPCKEAPPRHPGKGCERQPGAIQTVARPRRPDAPAPGFAMASLGSGTQADGAWAAEASRPA